MIAILFEWRLIEPVQWQQLVKDLDWLAKIEDGTALFDSDRPGSRAIVIDVWQSLEALESFLVSVLARTLVDIGLPQPTMKAWSLSGYASQAASINNLALRKSLERSMHFVVRN